MKIFLDDERLAPTDWLHARWPDEIISYLAKGVVDHDLGDDARGTGYDVLLWIEQAIVDTGFQPPKINVRTILQ